MYRSICMSHRRRRHRQLELTQSQKLFKIIMDTIPGPPSPGRPQESYHPAQQIPQPLKDIPSSPLFDASPSDAAANGANESVYDASYEESSDTTSNGSCRSSESCPDASVHIPAHDASGKESSDTSVHVRAHHAPSEESTSGNTLFTSASDGETSNTSLSDPDAPPPTIIAPPITLPPTITVPTAPQPYHFLRPHDDHAGIIDNLTPFTEFTTLSFFVDGLSDDDADTLSFLSDGLSD
ncbi:hypothetical protein QBC39DRAFT_397735 [Podospora conica]|nr:hypothetical protein QBC39DRAFT_397735 [Schizothecium conicum]